MTRDTTCKHSFSTRKDFFSSSNDFFGFFLQIGLVRDVHSQTKIPTKDVKCVIQRILHTKVTPSQIVFHLYCKVIV